MITEVVATLIWQGDRFIICQRPAHKARGLLWEGSLSAVQLTLSVKISTTFTPAKNSPKNGAKKRLLWSKTTLTTTSAFSATFGASSNRTRSIKPPSPSKCSAPAGMARLCRKCCRLYNHNALFFNSPLSQRC